MLQWRIRDLTSGLLNRSKMIEEKIKEIVENHPIKCPEGFLYELSHYLYESEVFEKYKVWRSKDPHNILRAKATISKDIDHLRFAIRPLTRIIFAELAWSYYGARSLLHYEDFFSLRFFTTYKGESYTTGSLDIGGNHFRELVRQSEKKRCYQKLPNPYELDFCDLEQSFTKREWEEEKDARNWQEDKAILEEMLKIIERLQPSISLPEEEIEKNQLVQDATRYNLGVLHRLISEISIPYKDKEFKETRAELSEFLVPRESPWIRNGEGLYAVLHSTIPETRRKIQSLLKAGDSSIS